MPADFRVQRGTTVYGAGETVIDVPLAQTVDLTRAFVRVTNVRYCGAEVGFPDTPLDSDRHTVRGRLYVGHQITFFNFAPIPAVDREIQWEVWEYVGVPGGPNEWLVKLDADMWYAAGLTTRFTATVNGNVARSVPIIISADSKDAGEHWTRSQWYCYREDLGAGDYRYYFTRGSGSGSEAWLRLYLLELTGSAWSDVEEVLWNGGVVGDNAKAITDVGSWANAFLVPSFTGALDSDTLASVGHTLRPGADTSTVLLHLEANCIDPHKVKSSAYVVHHPGLSVEHLDNVGGTRIGASAETEDIAVAAVADQANTGLILTASSDVAAIDNLGGWFNYRLLDADTVRLRQSNSAASEYALQVVQLPPPPLVLTPDPVVVTLGAPAVQRGETFRPDPVVVSLALPTYKRHILVNLGVAVVPVTVPPFLADHGQKLAAAVYEVDHVMTDRYEVDHHLGASLE